MRPGQRGLRGALDTLQRPVPGAAFGTHRSRSGRAPAPVWPLGTAAPLPSGVTPDPEWPSRSTLSLRVGQGRWVMVFTVASMC